MSDLYPATIEDVKIRFQTIFESVADIHRLRYGDKPKPNYTQTLPSLETLKNDEYITEYLFENLSRLYDLYKKIRKRKEASQKKLDSIYALQTIILTDLYEEIKALIEEDQEHSLETLWKELLG